MGIYASGDRVRHGESLGIPHASVGECGTKTNKCITLYIVFETVLVQSKKAWNGFDLVEKEFENDQTNAKYIFQIDYSESEYLTEKVRFRLYVNLNSCYVDQDIIEEYMKTIS